MQMVRTLRSLLVSRVMRHHHKMFYPIQSIRRADTVDAFVHITSFISSPLFPCSVGSRAFITEQRKTNGTARPRRPFCPLGPSVRQASPGTRPAPPRYHIFSLCSPHRAAFTGPAMGQRRALSLYRSSSDSAQSSCADWPLARPPAQTVQ